MPVWICATCGLEHADTEYPADLCAICADERQYVPEGGQAWNTLADVQRDRSATFVDMEPDLVGIEVSPKVGIGHRPLIVQTPSGNVLWDAPGFFDDEDRNDQGYGRVDRNRVKPSAPDRSLDLDEPHARQGSGLVQRG